MSSSLSITSCLIQFDHNSGPVVQCHYPDQVPAEFLSVLPAYALPDAIHKNNFDFVYFMAFPAESSNECFLGISCFKQCLTDQADRGCTQRAIMIGIMQNISDPVHTSLYTTLQSALSRPARYFFERNSLDHDPLSILKILHDDAGVALNASQTSSCHSSVAFMSTLKKLIASATEQTFTVIKAINAGAKVVIYSQSSLHYLTSTVLAFASLATGPISALPYLPVQYFEKCLQQIKHAIMGTNNHIVWTKSDANVFFNIDDYELRIEQGVWVDVLRLTRADRRFAAKLALPDNSDLITVLYNDYQNRAIFSLNLRLESDKKHDVANPIDDVLRDFNTSWAGIMFGFTKIQTDGAANDQQSHIHPCHDDGDGDDVFGLDLSLGSIWNSISSQTATIGDQAQRTIWEASSRMSLWVGSLAQSMYSNEPNSEDPMSHSVWTD